jgi:phosphatidylserine/phosphatidylglycerophosphate/cardiolipin synthase-like enzyme
MAQTRSPLLLLSSRDRYVLSKIYGALLSGPKSVRELRNALIEDKIEAAECESLLLEFIEYGILVVKRRFRLFDDWVLDAADAAKDDLANLAKLVRETPPASKMVNLDPGVNLVVTIPLTSVEPLAAKLNEAGIRFTDTLTAFKQVISEARRCLRISSPYVEESGMNLVLDDIAEAMRRGVSVRMLVREIVNEPNTTRLREMITLSERLKRYGLRDKIEIREFHKVERAYPGSLAKFVCSVHAKILIADARRAYVGSAEIRRYSIKNNFEVGTVLGGRHSEALAKIFDFVFDMSDVVTDPKLEAALKAAQ